MAIKLTIQADDKGSAAIKRFGQEVGNASGKVDAASQKMQARFKMVENQVGRLNKAVLGFAAAGMAGLLAAGVKVLKMSIDQEAIFRKLQTAVEISGKSWDSAKDSVTDFLAEMQKTTRFGDTDMAPALQMITQLSGSLEKGFEGARIAADVAASGLFDLSTASKYVVQAMAGEVTMLGRYIPELKASAGYITESMTATEKWAVAKDLLNKKFGGSAEKDLLTFAGMLKQTKNYLGDIAERAGDVIAVKLAPTIQRWRDAIIEFIESGDLEEWANRFSAAFGRAYDKIVGFADWIISKKDAITDAIKNIGIGILALEVGTLALKITALLPLLPMMAAGISGIAAAATFAGIEIYRLYKAIQDAEKALGQSNLSQGSMDYTNTLLREKLKDPEWAKVFRDGMQQNKPELKAAGIDAGQAVGEGINEGIQQGIGGVQGGIKGLYKDKDIGQSRPLKEEPDGAFFRAKNAGL